MHEPRPRIVVVAGPTAVGKTALGIELAVEFNGEVVNADSRYLYRGFDIGVAKPSAHGHAMIKTDTALTNAYARRGSGPNCHQTTNVVTATRCRHCVSANR